MGRDESGAGKIPVRRRCLRCGTGLGERCRAELCRPCVGELSAKGLTPAVLGELYRLLDRKEDGASNTFSDATFSDHFVDFLARHVPPTRRILEVGAGGGYLSEALRKRGFDRVLATDFNPEGMRVVRRRFPRLQVAATDASRLAVASDSVDVVISVETVEHLLDPARHFREVARVLKPGGSYLIRTPNRLASAIYYWWVGRYDMDIWHPSVFDARELQKALETLHFSVEHLAPPALPPSQIEKLPRLARPLSKMPLRWVPKKLRPSIVCVARKPSTFTTV